MNIETILNKLTPILQEVFDDDTLIARMDLNSADMDDWDSQTHIQLIIAIESGFGVRFTTEEITDLENLQKFVEVLQSRFNA